MEETYNPLAVKIERNLFLLSKSKALQIYRIQETERWWVIRKRWWGQKGPSVLRLGGRTPAVLRSCSETVENVNLCTIIRDDNIDCEDEQTYWFLGTP